MKIVAVLLVLVVAVLPASAVMAQTPTPTPFAIPATPTWIAPGNPGVNGVWTICTNYQGAGNVYSCQYLNNGMFSLVNAVTSIGGGDIQGATNYSMLIVPSDVVSVDLYCVYSFASDRAHPNATTNGGTSSAGGSNINRSGSWAYSQGTGYTIYHAHRGTTTTQISAWGTYVQNYPIAQSDYQSGFSFRTTTSAIGYTGLSGQQYAAYAQAVIQCQVLYYSTGGLPVPWVDENPPTPTPSNTLTPTPTNIGAIVWPSASPWAVATPVPVTIGVTPGVRACNTILPAFTFGPYTVFGYSLGTSWSAVEVCNTEMSFSWNVMGYDFAAWTGILVAISVIGLFYSRMR